MTKWNIACIIVTLIALGGWSQPSPGASIQDTGTGCFARDGNDILDRQSCTAIAIVDFTRGPHICRGEAIRATSGAVFAAIGSARRNLCPKSNALVPVSFFSQRVW